MARKKLLSSAIPEIGYLRIKQIIGDTKATPPIPAIVPVSKTTWYQWIAEGKAPQPVKLSERTSAWRVEDIKQFIESRDKVAA